VEQSARQRLVLLSYYLTLNHELPNSKSVFHHFSIAASSTEMSSDSEVELMMPKAERKRWAWPDDLKRLITRSRNLVG
jgi:hypothetical protein